MDGSTVLKRLREWRSVPVVILSVREREEEMISALDNGANDHVTKPFRSPAPPACPPPWRRRNGRRG